MAERTECHKRREQNHRSAGPGPDPGMPGFSK